MSARPIHMSLLLLFAVACDQRATASNTEPQVPHALKGREFESCASSVDCGDDLRCFAQTCRRTTRSVVGDYFAELGTVASQAGDYDGAVTAFAEALARYDQDKLPLPPDVDCAYGVALGRNRARREQAELAARVLHRCVLSVPAGSGLRLEALRALASLAPLGLDPQALARPQLADTYMSKGATSAVAPAPTVGPNVTIGLATSMRSYQPIMTELASARLRDKLVACRTAHKAERARLEYTLVSKYQPSEYDDEPGRHRLSLDGPKAGPYERCVADALAAAVKVVGGVREPFSTLLTIQ